MQKLDTRWNKIRNKDLTDWTVIWDARKHRYDEPTFWNTLDSKLTSTTFNFPFFIGVVLRFILSIVIVSNRFEPFPIGNNKDVTKLWKNWPNIVRYILWKLRNPFEDLRKFYIGFAAALYVDEKILWKREDDRRLTKFTIWMAKFKNIPFRIPFPYFKTSPKTEDGFEVMIGWKSRGILSLTVRG